MRIILRALPPPVGVGPGAATEGAGVAAGTGVDVVWAAPHLLQNLVPVVRAAPQELQNAISHLVAE